MKEFHNNITITGKLVKNNIEEYEYDNVEKIGGSLILRTSDMSEHEVNFTANKYKKDENNNPTSEETYFYKEYMNAKNTLRDIEHCSEGEEPDIVKINDGSFTISDFKDKSSDGIVSLNKIYAKFINKVEPKDYESVIPEAKFEIEGIIESIQDEIIKDAATGNIIVNLMAIKQKQTDFKNSNSFEADSFIPVKLTVAKEMADAFRKAGYYEGCFTKFAGRIINTVEIVKEVETAVFGSNIEKEIKKPIKKNIIISGLSADSVFDHELSQESINALREKRKVKLQEIKARVKNSGDSPFKPNKSTPAPKTAYNPFAQN